MFIFIYKTLDFLCKMWYNGGAYELWYMIAIWANVSTNRRKWLTTDFFE